MTTLLNEIFAEGDYPSQMELPASGLKIDQSSKEFRENYIDNFDRFQMRTEDSDDKNHYFKIFFSNGKQRKFHLNAVPGITSPKQTVNGVTYYRVYIGKSVPDSYVKDSIGLIYPTVNGKIEFNNRFTPELVFTKTKIVIYQQNLLLMTVAAKFAGIIGNYGNLKGINLP